MISHRGHKYKLEQLTSTQEAGTPINLFFFGGDTSPISAHKRTETYIGYEVGATVYLSPIIHDHSPGREQ